MNRRKLSHVIAVGVLAVLLTLPGTALAQGRRTRGPASVSDWLTCLWQRGISVLLPGSQVIEKLGPGIDPNGGKPTGAGGTTSPDGGTTSVPSVQGDQGFGIGPNA
jgi:hypothetical protein